MRNKGKNNVFAIGAPWLYLDDVYPQQTTKTQSGTVEFRTLSETDLLEPKIKSTVRVRKKLTDFLGWGTQPKIFLSS